MVHAKHDGVYVWDLVRPKNACGVSSKEAAATQALADALRAAPVGAEGILREASLPTGIRSSYVYTAPIVVGRHAPDGIVIWADGEIVR